jgi:Na+-transporting NADH:ubiquinone oxidoreductase subunit C
MAFDKNKTSYTLLFSTVMVVVVGAALAFTALALKSQQDANAADKKMMEILGAIGVKADRSTARAEFEKYITERVAIDADGKVLSSYEKGRAVDPSDAEDPFNIDVMKDYRATIKPVVKATKGDEAAVLSAVKGLRFPLYRCAVEGKELLIIPVVGSGLWGPIWGYVALESDGKTIYGANFDHKSETPGLGAEIKESFFTAKFPGKQIASSGDKVFSVVKGGAPTDAHSVDGITGGTITSKGVDEMVDRTMKLYQGYLSASSNLSASVQP